MNTKIKLLIKNGSLIKVLEVLLFVCMISLASKIAIPLPFTPVPVTLQVMLVILAGLYLGPVGAASAVTIYLSAILSGLPLTATNLAGPLAFVGPTAGYLIAFLPAVWLVGLISKKKTVVAEIIASIVGLLVIYLLGGMWLGVYLRNFSQILQIGILPFVIPDLIKIIFALILSRSISFAKNY